MNILAVTEQRSNALKKVSFEIARTAATLAAQTGGEAIALVIGSSVKAAAEQLGGYGIKRAIVVEHPLVEKYSATAYAKIIAAAAVKAGSELVLMPALKTRYGVLEHRCCSADNVPERG